MVELTSLELVVDDEPAPSLVEDDDEEVDVSLADFELVEVEELRLSFL